MRKTDRSDRSDKTSKQSETIRKQKKRYCFFCKEKIDYIDFKDTSLLRKFISERNKIKARRVTGTCAQHQRDLAIAIKRAREVALIPYSKK